jgi:predicted dehydrogenase
MAWERLHKPAFMRLGDKFEITAVCDRDVKKAKAAADELGLPETGIHRNYTAMLKQADIEAVDLMLPITENYEAAKAVINAKKHLIAEKPFASSPDAAKDLISLIGKRRVKVLVAENVRYDEEMILIKRLISEGKIGKVVYFIDNHVTDFAKDMYKDTFASAEWRKHPDFRGGVLLDSGVHHIARHRFLFGNIIRVCAEGTPAKLSFSPYSCCNAMFAFKENITGHYSFYLTGAETQAPLVGFRIFGTEGEIYLENKDCGFVNVSYKDGGSEAIPYKPAEGYFGELDNFYEAVRNGAEIVSTPKKELGDIQTVFEILHCIN